MGLCTRWRYRKGAIVLLTAIYVCSCRVKDDAKNPKDALNEARRLAEQGDYEGALSNHVWFHNNILAIAPSYYGVRLSFALRDWVELGNKYPKALQTLKTIRDEKTAQLLAGSKSRDLFHDVAAISESLRENEATVNLFKRLDAMNPQFASTVYILAEDTLVEAKEYVLAKKYLTDPTKRLATAKVQFESGMTWAKEAKQSEASVRATESIFTQDVLQILAVLRETGDIELAKQIQTEALAVLNNEAIKNALEK